MTKGEGHRLHKFSLRFTSSSEEDGFVKSRAFQLEKGIFYFAAIASFVITCGLIVTSLRWKRKQHNSETSYAVNFSRYLVLVASDVLIFLIAMGYRCGMQWSRLFAPEKFAGILSIIGFVPVFATSEFHVAKVRGMWNGQEVTELMGGANFQHDTHLILAISFAVVLVHTCLPVRAFILLPNALTGILLYPCMSLSIGSADPYPQEYFLLMTSLTLCQVMSRRQLERQERVLFKRLIEEKTLRAQAEHRLTPLNQKKFLVNPGTRSGPSSDIFTIAEREEIIEEESSIFTCKTAGILHTLQKASVDDCLARLLKLGVEERWLINANDITVMPDQVLGTGGYGIVMRGTYLGMSVAIKAGLRPPDPSGIGSGIGPVGTIGQTNNDRLWLTSVGHELLILRRLHHPNIVCLHGALVDIASKDIAVVLELLDGQRLDKFIACLMSEKIVLAKCDGPKYHTLRGVACALMFLHAQAPVILHGDLKPSNIWVEYQGAVPVPKLLDFGLSRLATARSRPLGGTLNWQAPEVISVKDNKPKTAADIFSFGRVSYFVLTGEVPIKDVPTQTISKLAIHGKVPECEFTYATPFIVYCRPIVLLCMGANAKRRPTMRKVFEMVQQWPEHVATPKAREAAATLEAMSGRVPWSDLGLDDSVATSIRTAEKELKKEFELSEAKIGSAIRSTAVWREIRSARPSNEQPSSSAQRMQDSFSVEVGSGFTFRLSEVWSARGSTFPESFLDEGAQSAQQNSQSDVASSVREAPPALRNTPMERGCSGLSDSQHANPGDSQVGTHSQHTSMMGIGDSITSFSNAGGADADIFHSGHWLVQSQSAAPDDRTLRPARLWEL